MATEQKMLPERCPHDDAYKSENTAELSNYTYKKKKTMGDPNKSVESLLTKMF